MSITAAQLNILIHADDKPAQDAMNRAGKASDGFGARIKNAFTNIMAFTGVEAVIGVVGGAFGFLKDQMGDVIAQGMSQQNVMKQTATVLKSTGDASGMTAQSIGDYADSMARLTGIQDDQIQASENLLLTFTTIGKKTFPQAQTAILDVATAMAGGGSGIDLKSATIQIGKALADPAKGLTSLTRIGVTFTAQQKEQIATMEKSGNIAGAQAVILKELQREFGGSAKAAGETFGGELKRMGVVLDQTKEKIGLALLPVLSKLLSAIQPLIGIVGDALTGAFNAVLPLITGLASQVGPLAQTIGGTLKDALGDVGGALRGAGGIIQQVAPYLRTLWVYFTGTAHAVLFALKPAFQAAGGLFGTFKSAFSGLLSAIGGNNFWQILANIGDAIQGIASVVSAVAVPVFQALGIIFTNVLMPAFQLVAGIVMNDVLPALAGLSDHAGQIGDTVSSIVIPAAKILGDIFNGVVAPAVKFLWGLFKDLLPIFTSVAGVIAANLGPALSSLQQALHQATPFFLQIFDALNGLKPIIVIVAGLFAALFVTGLMIVMGAIRGIIGAITGIIQVFAGVATYLRGFWDLISGLFTLNGKKIQQGLGEMSQGMKNIILGLVNTVLGFIGGFVHGILDFFNNLTGGSLTKFIKFAGDAYNAFRNVVSSILNAVMELPQDFINLAGNIIQGLINGIKNGIGGAVGAVTNLGGSIVNGFKNLFGIHSPSSVFHDFGLFMMHGLANGINAGATHAVTALRGVNQRLGGIGGSFTLATPGGLPGASESSQLSQLIQLLKQGQPYQITMDGRVIASGLMPHIADQIRTVAAVRHMG